MRTPESRIERATRAATLQLRLVAQLTAANDTDNTAEALRLVGEIRATYSELEAAFVDRARWTRTYNDATGKTPWGTLAELLGVTPQAIWKKYAADSANLG